MNPRWWAERLAASGTRWIGVHWGNVIPFYYVAEFPKSGGTWLSRMVADYLQIPFPQYSLLPVTFQAVVQTFGRHHPALHRVFYIYRDGRDVMTSLYFDRLRVARHTDRPGSARIRRTYDRLFGSHYDPKDIVSHLPTFLRFEFANPGRGSRVNWSTHIEEWLHDDREGRIVCLSYESLLEDAAKALGTAIEEVTGRPTDPWRLSTTIEKFSMQRQTQRRPGEEDLSHHIRKGIVGDWKNYFSREAAETFHELAGDTLIKLGYESGRDWVDHYDYPAP
jgi:hypothetical protein